jgi:Fe-S-cluster-containing dehydrogenase component
MSFIIELGHECATACRKNGSEISKRSRLYSDLEDCTRSGDCEDACRYVVAEHKPEFRIVKQIDGQYQNVLATHQDKIDVCKAIYFESESDWNDESICDMYLVWQVAHDIGDR